VSRALADAPDIGEATKRRVRDVAAQIGYRPDRAGVRLRTGKTNVISLVISSEHDFSSHTSRLIARIAAELRDTPYHVIVTPTFAGEDPMEAVRYVVETGSADALVLNQTMPEDPRIAYLMQRNYPFVTHGRTKWASMHPFYDYDNTAFAMLAIEDMAARNRNTFLLVLPPLDQSYAQHIRHGAEIKATALGVACHMLETATSDNSIQIVSDAIAAHLSAQPDVDAILCASSSAAIAASIALERAGRKLGEDVDVATKEAVPLLRHVLPQTITYPEDIDSAGRFLARAAVQAIKHPLKPPMQDLEVPGRKPGDA
jgi:LacI family transcriptional regulator